MKIKSNMSAKSNDSGHLKVVSIRRRYVQNTLQQHAFTHTKIIATAKRNIWATTRRMNPSECITNNRTHNKTLLLYSIYICTQLSVYVCGCFYVMKQMDWGAPLASCLLSYHAKHAIEIDPIKAAIEFFKYAYVYVLVVYIYLYNICVSILMYKFVNQANKCVSSAHNSSSTHT